MRDQSNQWPEKCDRSKLHPGQLVLASRSHDLPLVIKQIILDITLNGLISSYLKQKVPLMSDISNVPNCICTQLYPRWPVVKEMFEPVACYCSPTSLSVPFILATNGKGDFCVTWYTQWPE